MKLLAISQRKITVLTIQSFLAGTVTGYFLCLFLSALLEVML
jgi:hypothetical protein